MKVYTYTADSGVRHCREGMAVEQEYYDGSVFLTDTFWGTCDDNVLTEDEQATAVLLFDTDGCEPVPDGHDIRDYAEADRFAITHQHGLQRELYIRKGATPDLDTQIENARQALEDARSTLRSAESDVQLAEEELDSLRASA